MKFYLLVGDLRSMLLLPEGEGTFNLYLNMNKIIIS